MMDMTYLIVATVAVFAFAIGILVGALVVHKMGRSVHANREALFNAELSAMKSQFEAVSARLFKERSEEFKDENREHMETFTKPLLKELDDMREMLGRAKEGNDKNIAELNGAIKTMVEQSRKLGIDAENLADALKNRGKVQGDWGEVVLANILSDSGLRENLEYFTQKSYTDENGRELRPDVVVKCSDGSNVIVDSKVSLTAYTDYVSAENDEAREAACKENLASIVKHVDELANKNYPKVVPHAVPYVLMFVPNEGSYILAVNKDPAIAQKAYRKGVLIINPTNLMLALNLILLTWQNTRQEENCVNIMKTAEGLYEKFCGFTDNFVKVGRQLNVAQTTYADALAQLKDGKGNILSRFETMKQLGITSTKTVNEKLK
ncbi:DNA recombination protein RmuC [Fibrobacter succinogenes]|uniref:DNA recombination protein RmuC n=1 Tax=Fibrobacter succinogenes TaxID=833 RepID=UPI00156804FC|nr:DNA recombination protein RmuC [Fibrobacter succinogenes]